MNRYIPDAIRTAVGLRAKNQCEYCLLHQEDAYYSFQIDHIISLKHGGQTILENLALSCVVCNRNKGSDVGTVLLPRQDFVRFYNPRTDLWFDHFDMENILIQPKTLIGESTIKILDFNAIDRLLERQVLTAAGRNIKRLD